MSKRKKRSKKYLNKPYDDYFWENGHDYGVNEHAFETYLTGIPKYYSADDVVPLETGVEFQMASRFLINMRSLSLLDSARPILVHMKTCGGIWEEGMAIHNVVDTCPNPVTILSYTHARSMSSLVLQAADKRVLMPDSYFMFHLGTLELSGTVKKVMTEVEFIKNVSEPRMMEIYSERLKESNMYQRWSLERIKEMLEARMDKKEDVFLTPHNAVKEGFADMVFDGDWKGLCIKKKRDR